MMTEPNRTENQLTAEEFLRRAANPPDRAEEDESVTQADFTRAAAERPRLVRNEAPRDEVQIAGDAWPSGVDRSGVDRSVVDPAATTGSRAQEAVGMTPLLSDSEIGDLRSRWSNIQAEFVDEPRHAVEQADQLVATAIERLQEGFSNERASLEKQWASGKDASTEELRLALQRYRAFFGRLLNAA
jgi:hypothetical protein